ncbi:MAG: GntR family transcriptional regulator [Hyphomonas sp.]|jgi:DNA-binding GntR family transcriptional regulator|nr:GntR family transcriptional regulator [Hyphomonas sp.]
MDVLAVREKRARTDALAGTAAVASEPRRLLPVQPRTMVEQAAESIVAAAARGVFLPGDRLVEAEIARDLGISRVPVREALRLLESQGIVVSTPYKGMRLMQVSNRDVAALMRVRLSLETLAVQEAAAAAATEDAAKARRRFAGVRAAAEQFAAVARRGGDPAELVAANDAFHAGLCQASDNAPLHALWQSMARPLAVIWGLGQPQRDLAATAAEHLAIVAALEKRDAAAASAALARHILWNQDCDFEALVRARRSNQGEG